MTNAAQQDSAKAPFGALVSFLAIVLIGAAVCFAYGNSLRGEFVFDDFNSVVENQSIRHLWPLSGVLAGHPGARGATVEGRPVLNLSLAVNYALGGLGDRGLPRRQSGDPCAGLPGPLRGPAPDLQDRSGSRSGSDCHPNRVRVHPALGAPSPADGVRQLRGPAGGVPHGAVSSSAACMGPSARRGRAGPGSGPRSSIVAAFLCAGTKEVAVTLPVVVLLYDRTFLSGSFGAALRRRWPLYAGLAASWILLALLVGASGNRGGTIGAAAGMDPWTYALCQSRALIHYLRLCFWPFPLDRRLRDRLRAVRRGPALQPGRGRAACGGRVGPGEAPGPGIPGRLVLRHPGADLELRGGIPPDAGRASDVPFARRGRGRVCRGPFYGLLGRKGLVPWGRPVAAALGFATAERNKAYRDGLSFYRDIVLHRPWTTRGRTTTSR
jgi:hypothetical protein